MERRITRSTKDIKPSEPPKEKTPKPTTKPTIKSSIFNKDICIKLFDNLIEQNKKDKYNIKIINPNTGKEITQNGDTYKKIYDECLTYVEGTSYDIRDIPKPGEKKIKETFNDKIKKLTIEDINKWILNPAEEPFDYDYVYDKSINLDIFINPKYDALYKESFKLLLETKGIKYNYIIKELFDDKTKNLTDIENENINQIIYDIIKLLPKNHYITYNNVFLDILLYNLLYKYFFNYGINKINDLNIYYDLSNLYNISHIPKINITDTILFNNNFKIIVDTISLTLSNIKDILNNDNLDYYDINNILNNDNIVSILKYINALCTIIDIYTNLLNKDLDFNDLNKQIQTKLSKEGYIFDTQQNYLTDFTFTIISEITDIFANAKLVYEKYDILSPKLDFKLPSDISESPKFPIIHRDINLYKLKRRHNPDYELNEEFEKKNEEYDLLQKKYESDFIKHQAKVQHFYDKSVSDLNSLSHPNKGKNREQILKELFENPDDNKKCNNLIDINTQEEIKDMPLKKLQLLVKIKVRKYHDIDDVDKSDVKDFNQQDWTDNNKNPILFTYCYDAFALYNYVVDCVNNNKDPMNIVTGHQKKLSKENLQEMINSIKFINKNKDQRIPIKNIPHDKRLILYINENNNYYEVNLCVKIYGLNFTIYNLCTFPAYILPSIHTTGIENTSIGMIELLQKLFDSKKLLHKYVYPYYFTITAGNNTYYQYVKLGLHFNSYQNKRDWRSLSLEEQQIKLTGHYSELQGFV